MIGKVYKIIHNQSNIIYVGSTINTINWRWGHHKRDYKENIKKVSIYKYFEEFGIENFKMILIKEYEIFDKKQLLAYEQLWINKLKSININDTFGILKKEKFKNYVIKNIDKIKEYKAKWFKENYEYHPKELLTEEQKKEKVKKDNKKYRDLQDKDKIKADNKQYNIDNKEKIKARQQEKYTCECGSILTKHGKSKHNKSKFHNNFLTNNI